VTVVSGSVEKENVKAIPGSPPGAEAVLEIRDLCVDYMTPRGPAHAVDHVSFSLTSGEIFGLAGESGCGKSTIAHAIMRLIKDPGFITGGTLRFRDQNVLALSASQLRQFRWRKVSLVSQSAMNALNPVIPIGAQLVDALKAHEKISDRQARARAAELFELVGIEPRRLKSFSHQLSGGMRQRAVIAMALALNPEVLIMDEPTTALDVVVQRDILQQIQDLQRRFGFAILFITHDLSLLVELSNRIAVMYAGKLVEVAAADELLEHPLHPYTLGLMNSFPSIDGEKIRLEGIPGSPPDLVRPPNGCRFNPRCPRCVRDNADLYHLQTTVVPELMEMSPGHWVACHLY
jgi:peptide/nickel transport system ATP-binding protein